MNETQQNINKVKYVALCNNSYYRSICQGIKYYTL